jgi:hypothetical protein
MQPMNTIASSTWSGVSVRVKQTQIQRQRQPRKTREAEPIIEPVDLRNDELTDSTEEILEDIDELLE